MEVQPKIKEELEDHIQIDFESSYNYNGLKEEDNEFKPEEEENLEMVKDEDCRFVDVLPTKVKEEKIQSTGLQDHKFDDQARVGEFWCSSTEESSSQQVSHKSSTQEHLSSDSVLHQAAKQFYCDECKRSFKLESSLKRHMQVHSMKVIFCCGECSKSFTEKCSLNRHMRLHTKEKFHCELCKKSFARSGTLTKHMVKHSKEKLYHCELCNTGFSRKMDYYIHVSKCTGQKPHNGKVSKKHFTQRQQVIDQTEIQSYDKSYYCGVWKKCFTPGETSNTAEKPYYSEVRMSLHEEVM